MELQTHTPNRSVFVATKRRPALEESNHWMTHGPALIENCFLRKAGKAAEDGEMPL